MSDPIVVPRRIAGTGQLLDKLQQSLNGVIEPGSNALFDVLAYPPQVDKMYKKESYGHEQADQAYGDPIFIAVAAGLLVLWIIWMIVFCCAYPCIKRCHCTNKRRSPKGKGAKIFGIVGTVIVLLLYALTLGFGVMSALSFDSLRKTGHNEVFGPLRETIENFSDVSGKFSSIATKALTYAENDILSSETFKGVEEPLGKFLGNGLWAGTVGPLQDTIEVVPQLNKDLEVVRGDIGGLSEKLRELADEDVKKLCREYNSGGEINCDDLVDTSVLNQLNDLLNDDNSPLNKFPSSITDAIRQVDGLPTQLTDLMDKYKDMWEDEVMFKEAMKDLANQYVNAQKLVDTLKEQMNWDVNRMVSDLDLQQIETKLRSPVIGDTSIYDISKMFSDWDTLATTVDGIMGSSMMTSVEPVLSKWGLVFSCVWVVVLFGFVLAAGISLCRMQKKSTDRARHCACACGTLSNIGMILCSVVALLFFVVSLTVIGFIYGDDDEMAPYMGGFTSVTGEATIQGMARSSVGPLPPPTAGSIQEIIKKRGVDLNTTVSNLIGNIHDLLVCSDNNFLDSLGIPGEISDIWAKVGNSEFVAEVIAPSLDVTYNPNDSVKQFLENVITSFTTNGGPLDLSTMIKFDDLPKEEEITQMRNDLNMNVDEALTALDEALLSLFGEWSDDKSPKGKAAATEQDSTNPASYASICGCQSGGVPTIVNEKCLEEDCEKLWSLTDSASPSETRAMIKIIGVTITIMEDPHYSFPGGTDASAKAVEAKKKLKDGLNTILTVEENRVPPIKEQFSILKNDAGSVFTDASELVSGLRDAQLGIDQHAIAPFADSLVGFIDKVVSQIATLGNHLLGLIHDDEIAKKFFSCEKFSGMVTSATNMISQDCSGLPFWGLAACVSWSVACFLQMLIAAIVRLKSPTDEDQKQKPKRTRPSPTVPMTSSSADIEGTIEDGNYIQSAEIPSSSSGSRGSSQMKGTAPSFSSSSSTSVTTEIVRGVVSPVHSAYDMYGMGNGVGKASDISYNSTPYSTYSQ